MHFREDKLMTVEEVLFYARELLSGFRDRAHSFYHVKAVLGLLDDFLLNVEVAVEREALYTATILHDVGYVEDVENHALSSVRIMQALPLDNKGLIEEIILEHDYPKAKAHEIRTVEGRILWDIDNLESNGYVGLIRIQGHAKFLGKDLKWATERFFRVWRAKPEQMHFGYTAGLMQQKKEEERRYLPSLLKRAHLNDGEVLLYAGHGG
jgi:HD superfamily phosphodiesterase